VTGPGRGTAEPTGAAPAEPIRVVLVDDHEVVRVGLRGVLEADPGITVVAEAASGEQALAACEVHRPDLVIMDLHMPGMGGIEAIRRLSARQPPVVTLVLTMFEDDESVLAALDAGARGYVLKGAGRDQLRSAVRAAHHGQVTFGAGVADRVLERVLRAGLPTSQAFSELTPREHDVLDALAAGLGSAAIGRRLGLSEKTVRNRVSMILAKLDVPDRAAAIALARAAGLGGQAPGCQG